MARVYRQPGDVVVWRETWRDRTYFGWPVRVVEDSPQQTVVYVAEGTRYAFPPDSWPFGEEWKPDPSWPVPELPDDWET